MPTVLASSPIDKLSSPNLLVNSNATFKMFSVTGQKVLETRVRFNEQAKVRLPSLNSGVYIIRVSDGVHQTNRKFVIN